MYSVFDIRTDIRPTIAEIDLAALRGNVDVLSARVGPGIGQMAVVKADAYGHGALACARALERKVWGFAVSLVEEGVELRRGNIEAPIVVLGSFYGGAHRDVVAYQLTPVVSEPADLARFARAMEAEAEQPSQAFARTKASGTVGVHLKIDSGMARLGLRPERLDEFVAALKQTPAVELTGLCTHLAEADAEDRAPTSAQLACFDAARMRILEAGLRPTITHAANTAGTVRFAAARYDLVRPGLALYGYSPSKDSTIEGLRPVMTLKSRVVALRDVPTGATVSYGALFRAGRPSRIATIPVGYADGYTRRLSGRAQVLVGGRRAPVVGAITMDMCMVDVTDVPECKIGDEVVLLGAQGPERILADELATWAGTIPWEIFCGISKRVPRVYLRERLP